ncbi:hypothetical protein DV735_g5650, partial [Chaetothyriales sp. CBS 134920]
MSMNVFRVLGDLSHTASKCILIWAIHWNRSAEGVSLLTQLLYITVFVTRYLDLFWVPPSRSWWNFILKNFYIWSSIYIVILMTRVYARTREREKAWRLGGYLLGACLLAAPLVSLIFNGVKGSVISEMLWTFSIILESVCVLPQLLLLRQTTVPTVIDSFYLLTLGSYRAFYLLNWIYRFFTPNKPDPISVIFGIVQTAFYADFAWVYYTRQRVKLRAGGIVDSNDLRKGWLVNRIIDNRRIQEEDAEERAGGDAEDGNNPPKPANRWGARGVSVSADDTVHEQGAGSSESTGMLDDHDPFLVEEENQDDDDSDVAQLDEPSNKTLNSNQEWSEVAKSPPTMAWGSGYRCLGRLAATPTSRRLPYLRHRCRQIQSLAGGEQGADEAVHRAIAAESFRKPSNALRYKRLEKLPGVSPQIFSRRHIGPSAEDEKEMVQALSPRVGSLDEFIEQTIPASIRSARPLQMPSVFENSRTESFTQQTLGRIASENNAKVRNFIGTGYYGTLVPPVIQRNVLENPAWYTSYTPYQAEISQGRLESLLNFQTMVTDLTGLAIANASVLDEATAAAEAMTVSLNALSTSRQKLPEKVFVVSSLCHPQTIAVLQSRADGFGIRVVVGDVLADDFKLVREQGDKLIGALVQYPDTEGGVWNFQQLADIVHAAGSTFSVATDLLALTRLKPPGEFGADIAFGSAQRFGVPLGFGGPHAAFFACSEKYKRKIPGRLIGISKDRLGNPALRLALQTREQHIRREKATSNICTAQALLANMSAMYAVYHGPEGLRRIAEDVSEKTRRVQDLLTLHGFETATKGVREDGAVLFDTLVVRSEPSRIKAVLKRSRNVCNLRQLDAERIALSIDETHGGSSLRALLQVFGIPDDEIATAFSKASNRARDFSVPQELERKTPYLTHPVFNTHHSETEMLRYIHHLESKDLSLVHSMIPLGSCTMKLNATAEMQPLSLPGFANIHPFAPLSQATGYLRLADSLAQGLAAISGMDSASLQPNSGAQGEFAGLRVIKKYYESKQDGKKRNICLIPVSAHGTNPASAAMAGMKVVSLKCDSTTGNLDLKDLEEKCKKHQDELAAIMITYPSTYGVFEPEVKRVCEIVHEYGGQVYMDGANMNAQIGLCSPGEIGADVCHLNLHKTFCIPHGGGGPGVGPIAVKRHLAKHLPGHPHADPNIKEASKEERDTYAIHPVSAAPWGSASILTISWAYLALMGPAALTHGTKIALLNANYIMSRLKDHYPIVYTNSNGRCAHEFILDTRGFKQVSGIEAIDIAKRLQDYGFHAPTMSFPVANTLMIEPTESESKEELDRFCDAMIQIRQEIKDIEEGRAPKEGNLLKNSPHPQQDLLQDEWDRPYTRQQAAYPLPWLKEKKFWPTVARVDDAY